MARPSYLLFLISFSVTFLHPFSCQGVEHPIFFVFGDSLYDNGNNIFITPNQYIPAYHMPYGRTHFGHPTGRFSDGRVVPDFISAKLNIPFVPPILDPNGNFTYGANLASGGGGVFDDNPNALSFGRQIEEFKKLIVKWAHELGPQETNRRVQNAVYLIAMGGNDYFSYIFANADATVPQQQAFVDQVLGNFTDYVKEILHIGGRKFMFQNLAPIGCLPMMKQRFEIIGNGCAGKPLTLSMLHNDALSRAIEGIDGRFIYSIFSYFKAVGDRIDNPEEYGFKGGDVSCCGGGVRRASGCGSLSNPNFELCYNPNEYVFFDGGHNSDRANSQLADLMWSGSADVVYPFTLQQLFELPPGPERISRPVYGSYL